jgi:hypothetical protein
MSYCLDQIIDIHGRRLHFALKTALMCHVSHYQIIQQARVTAGCACQPDDLTVVSLTAGGFFQRIGIWVGSGQGNGSINDQSSDGNSSNLDVQIIPPHADRKLPAKPVFRVLSKTSLPAPKNGAGGSMLWMGILMVQSNSLLHTNPKP